MNQAALYPIRSAIMAAVLSLCLAAPVMAAEGVGRVLTASGTVTASTQGGGTRVLARDSRVYEGEIVETRDGRVQIRFIDGGLMSLDPDTRFEIEQYEQRDAAAGDADDGGSVFMNFLSGALRTITGVIGDGENETYSLETPVATVGIRGTQFSLEMCADGSCGADVDDGLYGHIGEGSVTIRNEGGDEIFRNGSFFRVAGLDQRPVQILEPPGFVLRGSLQEALARAGDGDGEGNGEAVRSVYNALVGRVGDEDILDGATIAEYSESEDTGAGEIGGGGSTALDGAAVAAGFIGGGPSDGGACVSGVECSASIDSNANLVSSDAGSRTIDAGADATLAEFGTESFIDARWGRWSGSMIVDGAETDGDYVWAYSNQATTPTQLATAFDGTGDVAFLAKSGPSPVGDVNGTEWNASVSVTMNFNLDTADILPGDVDLNLSRPGQQINLESGSLIVIDPLKGTGFVASLIDIDGGLDEGDLQARFAGSGAEGLLVEYEARDMDADSGDLLETIQGVQILKR